MKIGVAGCGRMGLPMARALRRASIDTVGHDIRRTDNFENLEMRFDTARFLHDRDLLISVVRDETQTDALFFGPNGLAENLGKVRTVVLSSTLDPAYTRALPARLPQNLRIVDAPVIGDPMMAEAARLVFLVGGDENIVDELSLVLAAMGNEHFSVGGLGAGMTTVHLNNFVAASSVSSVRAALDAAMAQGLDVLQFLDVLEVGNGQNWFGSNFNTIAFSRAGISPDNTLGHLERELARTAPLLGDHSAEAMCHSLIDVMRRLESTNIPLRFDDD